MRWQTSQLCVVVNYVIQIVEPLKPLLLVERTNLVRLVNLLFTTGSCFYIYIETTNKQRVDKRLVSISIHNVTTKQDVLIFTDVYIHIQKVIKIILMCINNNYLTLSGIITPMGCVYVFVNPPYLYSCCGRQ